MKLYVVKEPKPGEKLKELVTDIDSSIQSFVDLTQRRDIVAVYEDRSVALMHASQLLAEQRLKALYERG